MVLDSTQLDEQFEGPLKLRSAQFRLVGLIFVGFFGLFWNSVIGFGMIQGAVFKWQSLLFMLFMIPFVLIGLGLIVLFFYLLLGLFNPKVEIALTNGSIGLGDEFDLAWQVGTGVRSIQRLRIVVQARERATYRKGTDLTTDEQVVTEIPVLDSKDPQEIQFGTVTLRIPANSMHSFDGVSNKIKWVVCVAGEIPHWPDVRDQFEFRVKPFAVSESVEFGPSAERAIE